MRIGIITDYDIAKGGGVEESIVGLIKALEGHKIFLCCPKFGGVAEVKRLFDSDLKIDSIYEVPKSLRSVMKGSVLTRLFLSIPLKKMIRNEKPDLIIDGDGGLVDKFIPSSFPKNKYLIWKLSILVEPWLKDLMKEPKLWLKAIWRYTDGKAYRFLSKPFKDVEVYSIDLYTDMILRKVWGIKSKGLLYSPIKFNELKYLGKKSNSLVTVGRFSPEKDYGFCIEVLAELKKSYPKIKMTFLGACKSSNTKNYLNLLKEKAKKLHVENNVEFIINASFEQIIKKLKEAKIFFHAQKGISSQIVVTEAMAAGCIPLVRKEGGSWHEVVKDGKYGFGYANKNECLESLKKLLNEKNYQSIQKSIVKEASEYSEESFKKRVNEIINLHR